MKRLVLAVLVGSLCSACAVQRWVGKPVTRLEKEYGQPVSIRPEGENRVYIYPDELAGRGLMTFTVDRRGIIRSWCASADVPSVFGDDGLVADGGFSTTPDILNNGGTRPGGRLPRPRNNAAPASECR